MSQRDNAQWDDVVARGLKEDKTGEVHMAAVIAIAVVTAIAGVLVLGNLILAFAAALGMDSCAEEPCNDTALASLFLLLVAVGVIATVASWFTARSTRRAARWLMSFIAIGVPLIADMIALSNAPDWLI